MNFVRSKKNLTAAGSKIPKQSLRSKGKATENQEDGPQVKRSSSPAQGAPKKRTAFIDITNAVSQCLSDRCADQGSVRRSAHKLHISLPTRKKESQKKKKTTTTTTTSVPSKSKANVKKSVSVSSDSPSAEEEEEEKQEEEEPEEKEEAAPVDELVAAPPSGGLEPPRRLQRPQIPAEFDVDQENREDITLSPEYAKEIFDYLKAREETFVLRDYMSQQPSLNASMRAILVDWLVEVQENFELNHETLYLAVKMTDHFLSRSPVAREALQLIGSTTMLIAAKFEECSPPCVDDFLYICDDAYNREELIAMETNILQTLGFDINIPVPYRFLRRYAKCVGAGMDTLTLARYVCERSLQEMDLVVQRGSLLASACLLLALVTKGLGGWSPVLQFHSGYGVCEVAPLVRRLHTMLRAPQDERLRAIRGKYSHKVFFEVASLPVVDLHTLERALSD